MSRTVPCLDKEPRCRTGDPCLTLGSGIGKFTAHIERRINAQLNRADGTPKAQP